MCEKCRSISLPSEVLLKTDLVCGGELAPSVEADEYFDVVLPACSEGNGFAAFA